MLQIIFYLVSWWEAAQSITLEKGHIVSLGIPITGRVSSRLYQLTAFFAAPRIQETGI